MGATPLGTGVPHPSSAGVIGVTTVELHRRRRSPLVEPGARHVDGPLKSDNTPYRIRGGSRPLSGGFRSPYQELDGDSAWPVYKDGSCPSLYDLINRLSGRSLRCGVRACEERAALLVEDCRGRCVPACGESHALDIAVCGVLVDALGGGAA